MNGHPTLSTKEWPRWRELARIIREGQCPYCREKIEISGFSAFERSLMSGPNIETVPRPCGQKRIPKGKIKGRGFPKQRRPMRRRVKL